ncbi:MAG: hypothetical protein JNG86_21185 [Verrucomicrobiaceae bacterium]|nr:hypothetical protein [Verrucomicrobiaceae bacterium]
MNCSTMLRFACLALVLTLLPSCGISFRSAWKNAPAGEGVDGKWEGTWVSTASGHTGKLRAVVSDLSTPANLGAGQAKGGVPHQFHYHCTWRGILSAAFKTEQQVVKRKNGTYTFKGDHKMPNWVGGTYHYEGTVKGDDFNACYESGLDRGTCTMQRGR